MRNSRTCLSLLTAALSLPVLAIDPNRSMSQYVRDLWTADRGFPKGPVYSIHQTRDGYLWIGTEKGLVRFDGLEFELKTAAGAGLETGPLSHVLQVVTDAKDTLWIRPRRPSLLRYRDGSFENWLARSPLANRTVTAMAATRDGGLLLWILKGEPSAVLRRPDGALQTLAEPEGFSRSPVLAIAEGAGGEVWVGTRDAGLFRLRGKQTIAVTEGLPDPKVNAIAPGPNGEFWIGTDGGVVRWNGSRLTRDGVPASIQKVQALALMLDRDANLWVGTNSRGLLRVNSRGASSLEGTPGWSGEAVTAIFEDREGNIWAGSGRGLERFRDSAFVTYSAPEGVPGDGSNPVLADDRQRIWFAPANGGLMWFEDGEKARPAPGVRDFIYSIAQGPGGEMWAGAQHGGILRLRSPAQVESLTVAHGLAQDSVYAVYAGRDGSVWAGTLAGGVSRYRDGKLTTYTVADGLLSNSIQAILETSDESVWIGTPNGISALLPDGRWQSSPKKVGLPSEDVSCLLEDSTGQLWAGTAAGLAVRQSAKLWGVPPSLPESLREPILGMAEDKLGSLWIATSGRVLRVHRARLLEGALREGDLREYGIADGLRGVEGVKRFRSVVADASGRIWFSLNRGISVVDPARLHSRSEPAIVRVQSVTVDGKPLDLRADGVAHIPRRSGQRIVFGFAGLSLSVPERVRYRFRMDGFDQKWSEPTAARETAYTNLSAGHYRFRVMASNPDGVWNGTESTVSFEVDPRVWQTWWFRAAAVLAVMGVIFVFYRYRLMLATRRLNLRFEERLAERTRIAQELHDTLLQGFLSASMQVHVAADSLPDESRVKPGLNRAIQLMGQVIDEGRSAVRGLRSAQNAGSLDLEQAFLRVQEEYSGADGGGPAFRVIVDGEPQPLHPLVRDDIYRIGREALLNAFRHARASQIDIELKYGARNFRVLVRDNGGGIDPKILSEGRDGHWGLSGMRERADRIHATLRVWSDASNGTEIELTIPGSIAFRNQRPVRWLSWMRFPAKKEKERERNDERGSEVPHHSSQRR